MDEYLVQQFVAKYLAQEERNVLLNISIPNDLDKQQTVRNFLNDNHINADNIEMDERGIDIKSRITGVRINRRNPLFLIEAKGGNNKYSLYGALGQLILYMQQPVLGYCYGIAVPNNFRNKIRELFRNGDEIKPTIAALMQMYLGDQDKLFFFFVSNAGEVVKEPWHYTLRNAAVGN